MIDFYISKEFLDSPAIEWSSIPIFNRGLNANQEPSILIKSRYNFFHKLSLIVVGGGGEGDGLFNYFCLLTQASWLMATEQPLLIGWEFLLAVSAM